MANLDKKFEKWAKGLSGCDGGDPDADTWLCGIEWGGANENYYKKLQSEIQSGQTSPADTYRWEEHLTYPYGRSFAKLYAAIQGRDVNTYRDIAHYSGLEVFKLNLYPIAFRNTDSRLWKQHGLDKLVGFDDKHQFQEWCRSQRFPVFTAMVNSKKPALIIGTGISYKSDFFRCFAPQIDEGEIQKDHLISAKKSDKDKGRPFYWARVTANTTLVVIPFLSGRYGLNSNKLLQEAGERIRQLRV